MTCHNAITNWNDQNIGDLLSFLSGLPGTVPHLNWGCITCGKATSGNMLGTGRHNGRRGNRCQKPCPIHVYHWVPILWWYLSWPVMVGGFRMGFATLQTFCTHVFRGIPMYVSAWILVSIMIFDGQKNHGWICSPFLLVRPFWNRHLKAHEGDHKKACVLPLNLAVPGCASMVCV